MAFGSKSIDADGASPFVALEELMLYDGVYLEGGVEVPLSPMVVMVGVKEGGRERTRCEGHGRGDNAAKQREHHE